LQVRPWSRTTGAPDPVSVKAGVGRFYERAASRTAARGFAVFLARARAATFRS